MLPLRHPVKAGEAKGGEVTYSIQGWFVINLFSFIAAIDWCVTTKLIGKCPTAN